MQWQAQGLCSSEGYKSGTHKPGIKGRTSRIQNEWDSIGRGRKAFRKTGTRRISLQSRERAVFVESLSCDSMDCNIPGSPVFTVSLSLLKLMSIESAMPTNHLILCCPFSSCPQSFPASGSFPMNWLFTSSDQSIGVSALASVLPMSIQGWFPFELTTLISLLSTGLLRIFYSTPIQNHKFFSAQPSLCPALIAIHDYWKNLCLTLWAFVYKVMSLLFSIENV